MSLAWLSSSSPTPEERIARNRISDESDKKQFEVYYTLREVICKA